MLLLILLYSTFQLARGNSISTSPSVDTSTKEVFNWGCGYYGDCPSDGSICSLGMDTDFLNCEESSLTMLPTSIIVDPECKRLGFQNNVLKTLKMGTFLKADEVEELTFTDNIISSIDNYTFTPFKSLIRLLLNRNRLTEITPGMLDGLSNLKLLELGHNNIESISPLSFRPTPNLQELRLHFNPLFQLPEKLFRFLPNLGKLDLQDTGLVELPDNIFVPTPRLRWLSLSTNAFENVPERALFHAHQLQSLDLSENDFKLLLKGSFKRLSSLSLLHLNNLDRLRWIEEGAFAGLVKLKYLTCSYNSKLSFIDENVFGSKLPNRSAFKMPKIERFSLRENSLRTFKSPSTDMESLSSLSFVDLSENPWKCDCNLKWMTHLPKETKVNIRCNSPRQLRGRTFDALDPSELTCGGNWDLPQITLVVLCIIAFVVVTLAVSAVACPRTRLGLCLRAKLQVSYDKVKAKAVSEKVDLEWDPSSDV